MMLLWKSSLPLLTLLLLFTAPLTAQEIPEPMVPHRLVNDFAGVFTDTGNRALEQKLLAYHDSTST